MFWLIKMFLNRGRIRQLSAEWHEMHAEATWMLRLSRAAIAMGDFYREQGRYYDARDMFARANARTAYANRLIERCKANTSEFERLTSA